MVVVVAWRTDAPDTLFMKGVGLFLSLSLSDCDFVLINSVFFLVFFFKPFMCSDLSNLVLLRYLTKCYMLACGDGMF